MNLRGEWAVLLASVMLCFYVFGQSLDKIGIPPSASEKRKIIAVIDTGIDTSDVHLTGFMCEGGSRDFTGTGLIDNLGHGSTVAELLIQGLDPKKYCLVVLKYSDRGGDTGYNSAQAFTWANNIGAILINFSSGGRDLSIMEDNAIVDNLDRGAIVTVAAGNNGHNLAEQCDYFPACAVIAPKFYVVGALDVGGKPASYSNYGGPVVNWAVGSNITCHDGHTGCGTSFAAPRFANKLLKGLK